MNDGPGFILTSWIPGQNHDGIAPINPHRVKYWQLTALLVSATGRTDLCFKTNLGSSHLLDASMDSGHIQLVLTGRLVLWLSCMASSLFISIMAANGRQILKCSTTR